MFSKSAFGEKLLHFFSIFLPMLLIAGTFILIFSKVLNVLEVKLLSVILMAFLSTLINKITYFYFTRKALSLEDVSQLIN